MLFEIINPHDPYTLEAPDLEVAAVTVALIGAGRYGLNELTGDKSGNVPVFLTDGHDAWFTKQFGRTFAESLNHVADTRKPELIKALASVYIGNALDKRAFEEEAAACDDDEAFTKLLYERHDARRTSAIDIGRAAWTMADRLMEMELAGDHPAN